MIFVDSPGIADYLATWRALCSAQKGCNMIAHSLRGRYRVGENMAKVCIKVRCSGKPCFPGGHFFGGEAGRHNGLRKEVHKDAHMEFDRILKQAIVNKYCERGGKMQYL